MSHQQGNDMAAPEPLANTEPDKSAQSTIEDKLKAIVEAECGETRFGTISISDEGIARLIALITTETRKAVEAERLSWHEAAARVDPEVIKSRAALQKGKT